MKKLLLGLGAIASVAAPVAAVVACGSTTSTLSENGKKSLDAYKANANALPDGPVKTAALEAIGKIKSDQDLATFFNSKAGKDLTAATLAGAGAHQLPVVSAGKITSASLVAEFAKHGYIIDGSTGSAINNALLTNAAGGTTDTHLTFGTTVSGQIKSQSTPADQDKLDFATHNGDDFLIVIKGGNVATDDAKASDSGKSAILDSTDVDFIAKWGSIADDEFVGATSIIYLHHTGAGSADATVTVVKVIKDASGKLFEVSNKDDAKPITLVTYDKSKLTN